MKTIDYVKKHIKEWPEKCDYICVDDNGEIWLNEGNPDDALYHTDSGSWHSNYYGDISPYGDADLEDNDKVILKRDFDGHGTGNKEFSMDDFNKRLKALLQEAGQNGVAVNRIEADYYDAGTIGGEKGFVLMGVDVEYRM